jgi:hypothetical protein
MRSSSRSGLSASAVTVIIQGRPRRIFPYLNGEQREVCRQWCSHVGTCDGWPHWGERGTHEEAEMGVK